MHTFNSNKNSVGHIVKRNSEHCNHSDTETYVDYESDDDEICLLNNYKTFLKNDKLN